MHRERAIATLVVVATVAVAGAVLAARLSGAFGQFDAAAAAIPDGTSAATLTSIETSSSMAPTAAMAPTPAAAAAIGREPGTPGPTTATTPLAPVDAFLAARAELDSRAAAGTTLPPGTALASTDIASLLAADPRFQAALLDLARDAEPEVRGEAVQFLAGFGSATEPVAPE